MPLGTELIGPACYISETGENVAIFIAVRARI